eukprot:Seg800.12 transcript_id=Seg800.12/GoldUCD/mRNA.D3Y31 product="Thyrotroph embryonic factor" protein_id=Seg800.12/GoldUCD/D3Y31
MPPLPGSSNRNLLYNSESIESCPIDAEADSNDASDARSEMMDLDEFLVIHTGRISRPHNALDRETFSSSGNILSDLYYSVGRKRAEKEDSTGDQSTSSERPKRQQRKPRTYKYNPQPVCHKGDRNFVPDLMKDEDYWERRERNNRAAKKSREDRRRKEVEVVKKLADLEKRNADLQARAEGLERRNHYLEKKLKQIRGQGID